MENNDTYTRELLAVQRRLYAYIFTLVPRLTDADDVLQQTNAVLLRKRDEFRPGTAFGAWACQVAYFEVMAHRKRQQRERLLFSDELLAELTPEAATRGEALDQKLAALEQCTKTLPSRDRDMIHMRYRQELSSDAIAASVGRTAEAARRRLYRIRIALLRCIEARLTGMEG